MSHTSFELPRHPLGVRPAGNVYTAATKVIRWPFGSLTDELVIQVFEWLDDQSLLSLGATCKALYALTRFDEVWRGRSVE